MASLRKRLRNLFSTNVIVRKYGKEKLRVVDTNRLQSIGNLSQSKLTDRYSRLHGSSRTGYGSYGSGYGGYDSNYYSQQNRMQLYTDYEMMDKDPIISSALDIYSDESTLADQFGDILSIKTNKTHIQKILYNLFYDILNIEFNMWPWIRNLCKYGDFFLKLDIADEIGIINARPLSVYEIERLEEFNVEQGEYEIKFRHSSTEQMSYDVFEIAHFRMLSDSNFLPYGRSMLEGARQEFQKLMMLEGVGPLSAIGLTIRLGQPAIFKNGRAASASIGLTPKQHSSGGKEVIGHIAKYSADKRLRSTLYQGALAVIARVDKREARTQKEVWLKGIIQRRGKKVAAIALANKNVRTTYALIKNNTNYKATAIAA